MKEVEPSSVVKVKVKSEGKNKDVEQNLLLLPPPLNWKPVKRQPDLLRNV
jgi:hypothetical protein